MKKLLLLSLLACCCLFTSCEKGGSHALDGSKWECDGKVVFFSDGYAQYEDEPAVKYSIKGDNIRFSQNLASWGGWSRYDDHATLNKDHTIFTIQFYWWEGNEWYEGYEESVTLSQKTATFVRIIQ